MSDRVGGFVVVLEHDMRDEDAADLARAIERLRGVLSVSDLVTTPADHIARERARADIRRKLLEVLT